MCSIPGNENSRNEKPSVFCRGKKRTELRLLLQDHSVAQIYSFCFMVVKDASAFLDHVKCKGIKHASNTVPGTLKSIAARYATDGWEPFSYHLSGTMQTN